VPTLAEPEQVIPAVAHALLPTIFFAIFAGGLVSAILSTVDSTLLVSSGLLSHNLVVPILKVTDERTKVRIARAGVLTFGAIAYVQAIRADGVFELVENASAFGSAGVLVTVCFGLFTKLGARGGDVDARHWRAAVRDGDDGGICVSVSRVARRVGVDVRDRRGDGARSGTDAQCLIRTTS
jgi:Na+/proline symporter